MDNYIDYLFVGYTVTGKMETAELFETEIDGLKVTASTGDNPYKWFPHEQTEPCSFISVSGLRLPWALDEPFPANEARSDKVKKPLDSSNSGTPIQNPTEIFMIAEAAVI